MARCPSPTEAEAIAQDADPSMRNLRITLAYHELSAALATIMPGAANWCTFATWASRQAGQTIRREDLARKIEADLGGDEAIGRLVTRLSEIARKVGQAADRVRIVAAIRTIVSPVRAAERASDAVARGNRKVFEEIGVLFARFVPALTEGAGGRGALLAALRPGPPPDGQDLLRGALAAYDGARATADARAQAELMLLANLRIGYHEQTRLQPEIADALDAPIVDPGTARAALVDALLPGAGSLGRGVHGPLRKIAEELTEAARRRVRAVITAELMTLDLPDGQLRLGRDLRGPYPESTRDPAHPELLDLIRRVDPAPGTAAGSGALDWADFRQRMHYISELFRARQETASLFGPPFTPEQAAAIGQGQMPVGRL